MTSLIDKIEQLIKREKTTPDRKKDDSKKSSNEILSELFSAFNAAPPKIDEDSLKKSKKSKKKHKKEKKKRSRSASSSSDSDESDYSHKRKKRKKSKTKKRSRQSRSPSYTPLTPVRVKPDPEPKVKREVQIKSEDVKKEVKSEEKTYIKFEESPPPSIDVLSCDSIPMPPDLSPKDSKLDVSDLRLKLESKKVDYVAESDKAKGKIQIKNLKFSTVFEETVKKAEEEARKKAEKYEEGEYTDSSSSTVKEVVVNSQFPKSSDPGGILKKQEETKISEEDKITSSKKAKHSDTTKSSHRDRSGSRKRSRSKTRRSRSHSTSRKRRHRSTSKSRRNSKSRHRSSSKSRRRSKSRSRRSASRSRRHRVAHRSRSPRHRGRRSPTGVRLADSEKKRLLEVARRNAINMLKNGAVPAGAAALPPHTRSQVMAAIQSGGKSVDELTDFCKHLSKKEALGELSSVTSNDEDMSENEDTIAFHHPFLVKEKAPIVMNIRGGAPLPIKSSLVPLANKEELRLQFPVSSGSQHRDTEWVPVDPPKKDMQVAKLNSTSTSKTKHTSTEVVKSGPSSGSNSAACVKTLTTGTQLNPVLPALPAPGPQAYPPGKEPSKIDLALIVSQKLSMIRKEQEDNELSTSGFGWSGSSSLGQFTGSTGVTILTPRELASGTQAWAKKRNASAAWIGVH